MEATGRHSSAGVAIAAIAARKRPREFGDKNLLIGFSYADEVHECRLRE
jgi:hypothetical protein